MATGAQSFYSTPAFELFRRGLTTQTVKRFRGIDAFAALTSVGPDTAIDCLNVLIPGWGGVSKFRLPVTLGAAAVGASGPLQFFDFQQGNGTRQVVASFPDNSLRYFTWNADNNTLANAVLIEQGASDAAPWSMVEANNLLFMANGVKMVKWTGAALQNTGIAAPLLPPVTASIAAPGAVALLAANSVINQGPTTEVFTQAPFGAKTGQQVTIAGNSQAAFNGTFTVTGDARPFLGGGNGVLFYINVPGVTDGRAGNGGTVTPVGVLPVTGWEYGYAYKNAVTGHVGNVSPATAQVIPAAAQSVQLTAVAPADPQDDTIVWFRTLDGGGDLFRLCEVNLATGATILATGGVNVLSVISGGKFIVLNDNVTPDSALDTSTQGPLIHNLPPVGKYLAVGQSRVFIFNLIGASNQIAYSGYEQIVYPGARPEEAYPPFNKLRLQIGAEQINGGGVMQNGVVAFSATKKMYMLRGQVEDISLSAPVAFSAFLIELPWNVGTMCHDSIQSTPYGLLFWATDRTVMRFDGYTTLDDVSQPVYPILRRATAGQEANAKSAYFNWLERDWYGLTFAIDGSVSNNYTILWALQKSGEVDIFPINIQMDSLMTLTTPQFQRILAIAQGGVLKNLPVAQDTTGGVADLSIIPATANLLPAYWRGGYFGNDSPQRSKMYKRGMAVTDNQGFSVTTRLVDNNTGTINNPKLLAKKPINGSVFSIGQRAARCSIEIGFPDKDVSANLLELSVGAIATSDRM